MRTRSKRRLREAGRRVAKRAADCVVRSRPNGVARHGRRDTALRRSRGAGPAARRGARRDTREGGGNDGEVQEKVKSTVRRRAAHRAESYRVRRVGHQPPRSHERTVSRPAARRRGAQHPTKVETRERREASLRELPPLACFQWAQRDLNPRLQPCEGRTLPLSYAPQLGESCSPGHGGFQDPYFLGRSGAVGLALSAAAAVPPSQA